MQRATRKQREQFIVDLTKHAPKAQQWHAERIMRYGATYGRMQEDWCNREMSDKETERVERREKRIEEKVTKILGEIDCKPVFGGDPRGNTIKIVLPDGYADDWGREGLCVPTA